MRFRTINHLIRAGTYIATRPKTYNTVVVTGTTYYSANGVYYVTSGSGYVVVNAPPTIVVRTIPAQATIVYTSDQTQYYYAGGTYYVATEAPPTPQHPSASGSTSGGDGGQADAQAKDEPAKEEGEPNYQAVKPPVGVTVPYLPEGAEEKTVDGKKYHVANGTYYQPFSNGGKTIYMVTDDPTGT